MYEEAQIINIFNNLQTGSQREVPLQLVLEKIREAGIIDCRDPRLSRINEVLKESGFDRDCLYNVKLNMDVFKQIVQLSPKCIVGALMDTLHIQRFEVFKNDVKKLFDAQLENQEGEVLPAVRDEETCAKMLDENAWGAAICTIDGQRCFFGNHDTPFLLIGVIKPIILALALQTFGSSFIEQFVDHYGIHERCDLLCFDTTDKPLNPMSDSGFLVICCMLFGVKKWKCSTEIHQRFFNLIADLAANEFHRMKVSSFLKMKEFGDRAFSTSYFLEALQKLPKCADTKKGTDFFFEGKSVEANCESLSVMAATLANKGVNPLTEKKVLKKKIVKYVLSILYGSGMNFYSGVSGVYIGNPVKTSSSGVMFVVIPGHLGMALYSPRVDKDFNSVRGLAFLKEFIDLMNLHPYQDLSSQLKNIFPNRSSYQNDCAGSCKLFEAVSLGDLNEMKKILSAFPCEPIPKDNCNRTILHVAAAYGHTEIVTYLVDTYSYLLPEVDVWGRTAYVYGKPMNDINLQNKLRVRTN